MSTHLLRAWALALAISVGAGCDKETDAPPATPNVIQTASQDAAGAITANTALLKAGDFAGLMQNSLPPAKFAEFKAEWSKQKNDKPVTDEDRQKFATLMTELTAPGAETKLYAEASPKLKALEQQYQAQVPMYVNMGRGFAQNVVEQSQDLSAEEKAQAVTAVNAIGDWALNAKFTDQDLLKRSIGIAVETARALQLKSIDEVRAMEFDTAMKKAQVAFLGTKKILALYGFSIDDSMDSVKPTVVTATGDNASVKVDFNLLGKPMSTTSEMIRQDGHWYSKETIEKLLAPKVDAANPATELAQPPASAQG